MKSMTGYGRGQATAGGALVTVELSAVNHRQLDLRLDLPAGMNVLEDQARRLLRGKIARGAVSCRVNMSSGAAPGAFTLDEDAAARLVARTRQLARRLKLPDDLRASHLLGLPALLPAAVDGPRPDIVWPAMRRALNLAVAALDRMRMAEGRALVADLNARLAKITACVGRMERLAPRVAARVRRQLLAKINDWKLARDVKTTPDRMEREITGAVMRGDIAEELTRLRSHLTQAGQCLAGRVPAGRTLDFLLQEMFREINTVGSKAGDAGLARLVVQVKTELERVREQVQNLE